MMQTFRLKNMYRYIKSTRAKRFGFYHFITIYIYFIDFITKNHRVKVQNRLPYKDFKEMAKKKKKKKIQLMLFERSDL